MKKALAKLEVAINSENIEFDGIDGCSANDLAMMVQLLLRGVEDLTPNNINYVKF